MGREIFSLILKQIDKNAPFVSLYSFEILSEFVKCFLAEYENETNDNYKALATIVENGTKICFQVLIFIDNRMKIKRSIWQV